MCARGSADPDRGSDIVSLSLLEPGAREREREKGNRPIALPAPLPAVWPPTMSGRRGREKPMGSVRLYAADMAIYIAREREELLWSGGGAGGAAAASTAGAERMLYSLTPRCGLAVRVGEDFGKKR